jgi:hypothetical protein
MAVPAVPLVLFVVALFGIWFLYRLGHPKPDEPRVIFRFRRHPSAIPEVLAYLARGLFHPHLLRTGSSKQERAEPLPGDDLVPRPLRSASGPAWLFSVMRLILGKGDTSAHSSMLERVKARAEASYTRQVSASSAASG